MDTARNKCIWRDQCGVDCTGKCPDYTMLDDSEDNESYYLGVITENTEEYKSVIKEYSDGNGEET